MKTIFKKAERTARKFTPVRAPSRTVPMIRNRVAYAAAMEVLG